MFDYEVRELRRSAEERDPLDPSAVVRALDALVEARRRLGTPTELHLSALVDPDRPDRWTVTHPLLRTTAGATNAADAIILAAAELRDQFTTADEDERRDRGEWPRRRVDQAEWEALAQGESPEADALASALDHLAHVEGQLAEERDRAHDRRIVSGGGSRAAQEQTRARLRARSLERLASCNVEGVERRWSSDAFGGLDDFGLTAPVLVLAARASRDRSTHVDARFTEDRRWVALDHRVSDGVGSDSVVVVATPLETDMATYHRLARLTQIVPGRGDTVAFLGDYGATVDELFDGAVTVDHQRGPIGGGCWPVDVESLPALTGIALDDVDGWAEPDLNRWFALGPHWQLLVLGPSPER